MRRLLVVPVLLGAALAAVPASAGGGNPFGPTTALPAWQQGQTQQDAEPGMATAPDGQVWVASDVLLSPGTTGSRSGGGDVYTSTDGGKTYRWVAQPFAPVAQGQGLGGEDTDLTVAQVKNAQGFYTVYAASLTIADSSLAWSTDGGKTWSLTPITGVPVEDRPWLAADGPCSVYVAYHSPLLLPTDGSSTLVTRIDTCSPQLSRVTAVIGPDADTIVGGLTNPQFGKPWVDQRTHAVYLPLQQCHAPSAATLSEDAQSSANGTPFCGVRSVNLIAVSTDGGTTFTVHKVSDGSTTMAIWPSTVVTDSRGTVYQTWTDSVHAYINTSNDGGVHWSRTKQLDVGPIRAAVYPTVTALGPGRVDVAMYATTRAGNSNADSMGKPGADDGAVWRVWVARSYDGGRTFRVLRASAPIHFGRLCTYGSACSGDGSRALLDDFGASLSPSTGKLNVVFTSDVKSGVRVAAYTAYVHEL